MEIAASHALRRLGLPPDSTQATVAQTLDAAATLAVVMEYGRDAKTAVQAKEHRTLLTDLEHFRVLFGCAIKIGGAAELTHPMWAGCWCNGSVVFALYSK